VIVALVLLSAFLHALWNALLRLEPDKERALVAAVGTAALLATAVAGVRWAASGTPPLAGGVDLVWTLVAGALEWLYFMALAKALAAGALGPVYTISRGGAMLVVYPISIALLHEDVTALKAAGSVVVLAGLVLSGARTGDRRGMTGRALAWAIACASAIAGYHLAYKGALRAGGQTSAVFAVSLAFASGLNLVTTRGAGGYARARLGRVVLMGIACGASFLILMEALAGNAAGFVLTLRNTSVLFATALAFAIGERPHRLQILGALTVAAGAILMASS
jgi:uncharacterized membrane protein